MKKILSLVLSICMLFGCVSFAAAESREPIRTEVIQEATCRSEGIERLYYSDADNDWEDRAIPVVDHQYKEKVTTEATCEEDGVMTYTCEVCKDTYTEAIPATGHVKGEEPVVTVVASCTEEGEAVYKCANEGCDYEFETVVLKELGHDFGEPVEEVVIEATCSYEGMMTVTTICNRCGEAVVEEVAIEKDSENHNFGKLNVDKKPTCTEDGFGYQICFDCKTRVEVVIPATGHTEGAAVKENEVAPACTVNGSYDMVVKCTVCGAELSVETFEIEALGHEIKIDDTLNVKLEPACEDTGLADGICAICGELVEDVVLKELGHVPGEAVVENEVEATCTEDGSYDTVVYCTVCDEVIESETTVVPALGHTNGKAVKENVVEATCTEKGSYDRVIYCTVCGEEVSRVAKTVKANGHVALDPVVENEIEATCTEDGSYEEVVYCEVCGEELSRETTVVESLGHDWTKWTCRNEPTDETLGFWVRNCNVCELIENVVGTSLEDATTVPCEHEIVVVEAVAATCTEDGLTEGQYCSVCNEVLVAQEVVEALGHTEVVDEAVEATCTEDGLTEGVHCSVCGAVKIAQQTVEATGHDWDDGVITTEATVDADGVMLYTCAACGETREEAVEYVATADPIYVLTGVEYDGEMLTGKLEHDPETKTSDKLFVRVAIFAKNGTYTVTTAFVLEDGSFEMYVVGDIEAIYLVATGSTSVKPGSYESFGSASIEL